MTDHRRHAGLRALADAATSGSRVDGPLVADAYAAGWVSSALARPDAPLLPERYRRGSMSLDDLTNFASENRMARGRRSCTFVVALPRIASAPAEALSHVLPDGTAVLAAGYLIGTIEEALERAGSPDDFASVCDAMEAGPRAGARAIARQAFGLAPALSLDALPEPACGWPGAGLLDRIVDTVETARI